MNKKIWVLFAGAVALAGCATEQTKHAIEALRASPIAFGVVTQLSDGSDVPNIKSDCAKSSAGAITGRICADIDAYQIARIFVFRNSVLATRSLIVPRAWGTQVGSIVEYAPNQSGYATRLAALKPTETCRWTGPSWEDSTTGLGLAKHFAMGMLIIPAVATSVDGSIMRAGVECDGWSYKQLLAGQ